MKSLSFFAGLFFTIAICQTVQATVVVKQKHKNGPTIAEQIKAGKLNGASLYYRPAAPLVSNITTFPRSQGKLNTHQRNQLADKINSWFENIIAHQIRAVETDRQAEVSLENSAKQMVRVLASLDPTERALFKAYVDRASSNVRARNGFSSKPYVPPFSNFNSSNPNDTKRVIVLRRLQQDLDYVTLKIRPTVKEEGGAFYLFEKYWKDVAAQKKLSKPLSKKASF